MPLPIPVASAHSSPPLCLPLQLFLVCCPLLFLPVSLPLPSIGRHPHFAVELKRCGYHRCTCEVCHPFEQDIFR